MADAFNLVCTFTIMIMSAPEKLPIKYPGQTEIRIDLDAKRYCTGDCKTVKDVFEVTDKEITLEKVDNSGKPSRLSTTTTIDRYSGVYWLWARIDESTIQHNGTCERKPFTGLPERRF